MTAASVPAQSPDPTPFRELLAAEVRAHLARQRLSNRKFARMLGLQPTWVDRRLNGTTPMTADDIDLFASALGLTPEQLMAGAFRPQPGFAGQAVTHVCSDAKQASIIPFPLDRVAFGCPPDGGSDGAHGGATVPQGTAGRVGEHDTAA